MVMSEDEPQGEEAVQEEIAEIIEEVLEVSAIP